MTRSNPPGYLFSMALHRLAFIAFIAFLAGGCDGLGFGEACTRELGARFAPADTTIEVGQSFQASVRLTSCGGKQQLADVITWRAEDSAVATVDGRIGRVAGHVPGTTRVLATGERYGPVGGLQVSVRAAGP